MLRGGAGPESKSKSESDYHIVLDDNTRDMEATGLRNIVKCRGWIGFSEEEYQICKDILNRN
jgi:hypothetical protein